MGRHRSAEEKMEILNRYFKGETAVKLQKEYDLPDNYLYRWINKYKNEGYDGLKSNVGKSKGGNRGIGVRKPKNKIEELELEIMKKDIEIARLKKGYMVKGVGQKKEYVTTLDKNTK